MIEIKDNTRTDKTTKKPNIIHLKSIGVCEGHLCVVLSNEVAVGVKKFKIGGKVK